MRHNKQIGKLNRTSAHRKALLRNLVIGLIEHDRIRTTETKAKVLQPYADKLVSLAKDGSLPARRRAFSIIGKKEAVHRLFTEVGPRFADRNGGYTRVIKYDYRPGDNASMAFIEFTEKGVEEKKVAEKSTKSKSAKKVAPKKSVAEKSADRKIAAEDSDKV